MAIGSLPSLPKNSARTVFESINHLAEIAVIAKRRNLTPDEAAAAQGERHDVVDRSLGRH